MSESLTMYRKIACPYCQHDNRVDVPFRWASTQLITCDTDEGGCDKAFVVNMQLKVSATVFKLQPTDGEKEVA